jgi:hypothetical protein
MALQLAENPQTGERIALINGQWVPFTEMAQNPQTGERAVKVDGLWYTEAGQALQQPAAPQEESGFFRQAADVPVQFATGIATGIRLISDAFGADNPVSQNIRGVEGYLQGLLSAQAKNDQQEIARIMKEVEDKGIGAQLTGALEAFTTAPVDFIAQAAGTAAPTIVGGLAAQALRLSARLASTGIGSVMGAGVVKSSIYDEVKQTLTDLGASPEDAEKRAVLAQEYGGENLDQILLGTVLGGAAGRFGIEPNVAKALAGEITRKSVLKAAGQEAVPEAAQGFQEQVAQNIALQRESEREPQIGEVPTFRGAVGAGALEGLAGLGVGAVGEVAARQLRPEAEPAPEITPAPTAAPEVEPEATPAPPAPEGEASPALQDLLADIEEVEPAAEEAAATEKFESVVEKIRKGEPEAAVEPEATAAPEPTVPAPTISPPVQETEAEVVDYDTLQSQQDDALQKSLLDTEEKVDASPAPTAAPIGETKPRGRGERPELPVSGRPAAATEAATPGTLAGGVGNVTDATSRPVTGERGVAPALEKQTVETPQDRYESVLRRIEGLVSARRATPIIINRLRTQAREANPARNPEGYELILKQAEEILDRFEESAEKIESDQSVRGLDLREKRLKEQESVALDRAQRQIEQNRIADSLRDNYDRTLTDQELMPKYALEMRDALEANDLKSVTQLLVDKRSAVDAAPKRIEGYRPIFTAVARKLNSVDFGNVKVQTEATPGANLDVFKRLKDERKLAEYDPSDNTLYIRRDKVSAPTVQHELVHAGTVQTLRQYEIDKSKLTPEQRLGVERLIGVYDLTMQQMDDASLVREYPTAFENLYEFVAVAMSSPMFQSRLARIEVMMPVGRKNLWTEFVDAIGKLFGLNFQRADSVSALDEVGQAFSEILAAPVEGGITGVNPLAAKQAEKEPKPKVDPFKQTEDRQDALRTDRLTFAGLVKYLTSSESVEETVRKFQDAQRPLLQVQRELDRANLAVWTSGKNGGNTIAAANDMSAGLYANYEKVVAPKLENLNKAVSAYQARTGKEFNKAMARLDTFFTAETSDQRRLTNYLKEKPLKTTPSIRLKGSDKLISYAQLRDMLIDSVQTKSELSDQNRDAIYNRLLQLAGIEIGADGKPRKSADADKYADPLGASYGQLDRKGEARKPGKRPVDFEDPAYDIIQDWDYETNNDVLRQMAQEMKTYGNEIKAVREALIELDKVTQQFNAEANHLTQPAKNLIKLYGWDKYVPLMGKVKPKINKKDQFVYLNTVPNDYLPGFRGRETAPDSPILMTQVNAGKAATRAARADIVPTLINLIKPNPKSGRSYVKGEMVGVIKFNDRYKGEVDFDEKDGKGGNKWIGKDKFYNYLDNGDIEVWRVDDKRIIESLRPEWEPPKGLVGRALAASQKVTNVMGQGHTRYKPSFAPYDFPRNLFANSGAITSELGPLNAAKYMTSVGNQVFVRLRIPQMWRVASAHYDGDFAAIRRIGGYNATTGQWRDTFVRDAYEYLERGGRTSVVRSWQTRGKLEQLIDEANKGNIRKNTRKFFDALNKIFDLWLDGFELVARVEGYRVAKSYAETERNMSPEEAERYGVSFGKNLANFEKKGVIAAPGALYVFWNPSATGAVRAFDAILPAFRNPRTVIEELPEEIKNDPEAKANYYNRYLRLKRNAQIAIAFYGGVGYMSYMMALSVGSAVVGALGDDEEPENPVAKDNKELWTRNMRIPLGWLGLPALEEKYFQIPWGFGIGAFAAAGAQTAAVVTGGQSLKDYIGNLASIGVDSYLPLPFARYNPIESPFNWMISSIMPSALRPIYEYNVNMGSLGSPIYRDYYNRYGPAYAGSENIEEAYRYVANMVVEATDGRIQREPNEYRYLATAYFDGLASFGADVVNVGLLAKGAKDFDPKTDLLVLDSFIGNKISPSLITFKKAEERLEVLKRGYDTAINSPNPRLQESFLKNNPNAPGIVALYNRQVANMREFRAATTVGEVYAETPRERKEYKKEMNKIRDVYMEQVNSLYKTYEDDINEYYRITPRIFPD